MALSLGLSAATHGMRMLADNVCSTGVFSCSYGLSTFESSGKYPKAFSQDTCANYDGRYVDTDGSYGLLVVTAIFAAAMAFSIGGNDGANAWATTIHSFAIKFRPAVILAAVFEALGATTIGYGVSGSIQKGITNLTNPECFACGFCNSSMSLYYIGMMASLISASMFLIAATWLKMPVSTTHAIVSSVFGMTIVFHGFGCIKMGWDNLGGVIASWFISPVLSGVMAVIIYYIVQFSIFRASNPRTRAYYVVPLLYLVVVFVIVFMINVKAPKLKSNPRWYGVIAGLVAGALAAGIYVIFVFPRLKKNLPSLSEANRIGLFRVRNSEAEMAGKEEEADADFKGAETPKKLGLLDGAVARPSLALQEEYEALSPEQQDAMYLFKYLLVMVACLQSFSHGSNDTANATAALAAVVNGFKHGLDDCASPESPWWIMLLGGVFLGLGIWFIGHRVMDTIGKNICIVSFDRAFCTEFASACTVVLATLLNIPVSTTHCQVGAVIFISMAAKESGTIQWKLVFTILFSWIATLPFTAGLAALVAYILSFAMKA
ncbi:hypothetical protein Poli38472_001203 [Pythium oligandrum]|uniref:Phosphate transporter n=1 Tax=Pythium oligandrum TaxID=41045 RepID=A0A8K1FRI9_PYTOL|nr:hypothetical protein Poli38472_001202 [Pythium oligandrum]TMW69047.1 hypothetical protein Poli38472_001203 [Pythium oligandrum]|eukprot:TMW69046.1 hypothetical protein Poli38472_001202 [Pythium oligandrum]